MYFAAFKTLTPLSHVPRALDELARVDYCLSELRVTPSEGVSVVELFFLPSQKITVDCLLARLARIPGIEDLEGLSLTVAEAA